MRNVQNLPKEIILYRFKLLLNNQSMDIILLKVK